MLHSKRNDDINIIMMWDRLRDEYCTKEVTLLSRDEENKNNNNVVSIVANEYL